ncbi:hypothetical protein [Azospirillum himalayense]|uniref:Uncharacterized protein n=1 Tax=Azospirillum himalayense TaxID=654847 RepID=A0ABW0G250_9PROT
MESTCEFPKAILTDAESSRVHWASDFLGCAKDEAIRLFCQVKSFLLDRKQILENLKSDVLEKWDTEGKASKALVTMTSGAMAGVGVAFSKPLGVAMSTFIGGALAPATITALVVVVGVLVLFMSVPAIPGALMDLSQAVKERLKLEAK